MYIKIIISGNYSINEQHIHKTVNYPVLNRDHLKALDVFLHLIQFIGILRLYFQLQQLEYCLNSMSSRHLVPWLIMYSALYLLISSSHWRCDLHSFQLFAQFPSVMALSFNINKEIGTQESQNQNLGIISLKNILNMLVVIQNKFANIKLFIIWRRKTITFNVVFPSV